MSGGRPARYAAGAAAVGAAAGAALWVGAAGFSTGRWWAVAAWAGMVAAGVAGGAWLASQYGKAGAGFVLAAGAGMLARAVFVVAGLATAAGRGAGPRNAFVAGLAAGYVPLQVYEIVWFFLAGRRSAAAFSSPRNTGSGEVEGRR